MESDAAYVVEKHPHEEVERLIRERDFNALRQLCENWEPFDLAHMLLELPPELEAVAFRVLPKHLAADAFEYLEFDEQERLLHGLGQKETAGILDEMAPDDRTALLEELPSHIQQKLLGLLNDEERRVAKTLLGYPEDTVGRLMTTDYVTLRKEWTVGQALDFIRDHGQDKETLNVVYVVDENGMLIDGIRIRRLLLAQSDASVGDLVNNTLVALFAGDPAEEAVEVFRETDLFALPVVNSTGKILGIVTLDDVLDVAEERATSDMQKLGASSELEDPYLELSTWQMLVKRGPWLVILFLGGLLTANAMAFFEEEIEKAAVLIIFLPLIIASGGNSGSQAATLIVRAMAVGDVRLVDWFRVLGREVFNGLAIGALLGVIGIGVVSIGAQFSDAFTIFWPKVGLTVGLALLGVVLWGSLIGSMLPLLLKKVGLDPATSSAPFVSTFVDVTGIVIYFTVASMVLRGTLL